MAIKVHTMKKKEVSKKDKNQFIWDEFVLKNSIKKKFQVVAALIPTSYKK